MAANCKRCFFLCLMRQLAYIATNAGKPAEHCKECAIALGARLKPNVVPAKLFQCSRLSGRNKKSSKFICPPTKPTRT